MTSHPSRTCIHRNTYKKNRQTNLTESREREKQLALIEMGKTSSTKQNMNNSQIHQNQTSQMRIDVYIFHLSNGKISIHIIIIKKIYFSFPFYYYSFVLRMATREKKAPSSCPSFDNDTVRAIYSQHTHTKKRRTIGKVRRKKKEIRYTSSPPTRWQSSAYQSLMPAATQHAQRLSSWEKKKEENIKQLLVFSSSSSVPV